eukprot:1089499-Pleurochrysis_carterae.AAC.1
MNLEDKSRTRSFREEMRQFFSSHNQILEAQRRNGKWVFLTQWAGSDTPTIQPESDFEGCDSIVRGMLDMAKARYLGTVEEAAKRSGARKSRVKT